MGHGGEMKKRISCALPASLPNSARKGFVSHIKRIPAGTGLQMKSGGDSGSMGIGFIP